MTYQERLKKFNNDVKKYAPIHIVTAYIDLAVSVILFGASFDDYIRYRFWEKSLAERNRFITYLRSKRIIKKFNAPDAVRILDNKALFNQKFSKYLHREWLLLKDATEQELRDFMTRHPDFICKELSNVGGRGIHVFNAADIRAAKFLSENRACLIEELIVQHPVMAVPNPTSVNTVRMITVNKNGTVIPVAATIRIGAKGSCVDNVCSGGTAASIDMESGVVFTKEIDEQYNRYIYHPGTDVCVLGMKIPNWECVVETVKECAALLPEARYIGWDIAVTEQGCSVIEGNHNPAHSTYQEMDQVGKYQMVVGR